MNHSLNVILHLNKIKATEPFIFILKNTLLSGWFQQQIQLQKKKKELTIRYLFEP